MLHIVVAKPAPFDVHKGHKNKKVMVIMNEKKKKEQASKKR